MSRLLNRRNLLLTGGALVVAGAGAAIAVRRGMGSMQEYNAAVGLARTPLMQNPEMSEFIRYATLAASGHNTQPWRFRLGTGQIDILPDFSRRTAIVDPDDHHLFVSLGCAAENLSLAAGASGRAGELHYESANDGSVVFTFGKTTSSDQTLFESIPRRQSTRAMYDGKSVSVTDLHQLAAAAAMPGVDVLIITERERINQLRDLVIAGNSAQLADPAFIRELKSWLRFNPRAAMASGDGLFSAASGSPTLPSWLGPGMFDWAFTAQAENQKYARQIDSSAGLAVFVSQHDDREHWFKTGRSCQRFALQATALGLKHAFINQPVEVPACRQELANLLGLPDRRPDLLMRFGYGAAMPYSARRPVELTMVG
jgi:nitroreductase